MSSQTNIRLVRESDCQALLEIYGPFVTHTTVSFEYELPTEEEFRGRIRSYSEKYPWLVCELDGKVVGYAYASKHRDRTAYQWSVEVSVYVHPEYHKKHIAKALYTALFEILELQGFISAYAGVAIPNEKSRGFHVSFGFKPIGIYHKVGYKLGKWLDTEWFERDIATPYAEPQMPKPIAEICETDAFIRILNSATRLLNLD